MFATRDESEQVCVHLSGYETRDGRRLCHSSATETEILLAQDVSDKVLPLWAAGKTESGAAREETLVFLICYFSRHGQMQLASDLAAILNSRVFARIVRTYGRTLGSAGARQFASDVCSDLWVEVLDATRPKALWAQVCFWTVVRHMAADSLHQEQHQRRGLTSLNSDRSTMEFVQQLQSRDVPLDDLIYAQEFLDRLHPKERYAFVKRYACDESAEEIGCAIRRCKSSVNNYLREVKMQLANAA